MPLVSCDWFSTSLLDLTEPFSMDLGSLDSFVAVTCVEGCGRVECSDDSAEIRAGSCLLVPASESGVVFEPSGEAMRVLITNV